MNKKKKMAFAMKTLNNPLPTAQLAKSDPEIAVKAEELDKAPYLFNCQNGVVDLKTGKLLSHDPDYKITKISPASYDPEAKCPLWEKSLDIWFEGDKELIGFFGRMAGMGLTGDTTEHKILKMIGSGRNGKSVCSDILAYIAGDYASFVRAEVFLKNTNGNVQNQIAEIRGSRYIFSSEFPQGAKINSAFIKEMAGGETIKGRQLYQQSVTFKNEGLIVTTTNWPWIIEGEDRAIIERLIIIPFNKVIPEHERDRELSVKLKAEIDGILAWAVRGCLDWQQNGLNVPQKVKDYLNVYADSMDMFGQFIDEMYVNDPNGEVAASIFLRQYNQWLETRGDSKISARVFSTIAKRRFGSVRKSSAMFYQGLSLRSPSNSLGV